MFEGHINNCVQRVIYALFELRDKYICWPSQEAQRLESLQNHERAGFIEAVGKVDETDIVLYYKCKTVNLINTLG